LVGYPDGCVGSCVSNPTGAHPNSYTANATIARQSGGKRLFVAFDPISGSTVPASPRVDNVYRDDAGTVHVNWKAPDNGGSPITGYNIYRTTASGTYGPPLATLSAGTTPYNDAAADPNTADFDIAHV